MSEQESVSSLATGSRDHSTSVAQILPLLKAKDDTSRFVGLSILRSLLDVDKTFQYDKDALSNIWATIPTKFLTRLLQARASDKRTEEEADAMRTLAISIIHAFSLLLNRDAPESDRMIRHCGDLLGNLPLTTADTRQYSLQAISMIATSPSAALKILELEEECITNLTSVALEDELAREVLGLVFATVTQNVPEDHRSATFEDKIFEELHSQCNTNNYLIIFEILANLLEKSRASDTKWASTFTGLSQDYFRAFPSNRLYRFIVRLFHHFLAIYPNLDPFFNQSPVPRIPSKTDQPFSYLFSRFLLIDIRATIPSLMEILASPDYPAVSIRLAKAYDVLSSFIRILLDLANAKEDEIALKTGSKFDIAPDLLLKMRKDLSETMSMTIEFFRDRWDAARSGTAGLHPSALPTPEHNPGGPGAPKSLTWESPTVRLDADPIVVSGSRVLSLWLHEDDNEQLRTEATGLMDVFIALYDISNTQNPGVADLDYRNHIVLALEALVSTSDNVKAFVEHDGWNKLFRDLQISLHMQAQNGSCPMRVLSVIRTLLLVVESEEIAQPKREWMEFITLLANHNAMPVKARDALSPRTARGLSGSEASRNVHVDPSMLFAQAGILAQAIISKAPVRLRQIYEKDWNKICDVAEAVLSRSDLVEDVREALAEIVFD